MPPPRHVQMYQDLIHSLLEVNRLWREGDPASYSELVAHVEQTDRRLAQLAVYSGQNPVSAKRHDMKHIPVDLFSCGSSIVSCTGQGL